MFGQRIILFFVIISNFCLSSFASENAAFKMNKKLGRGVNLANALDAPQEGQWGVILEEEYFKLIKKAGFDSVRIPIRWSAHAMEQKPYTIEPEFFERVDWAVKNSLSNGLNVIINMHHYEQIYENPEQHRERFIALWQQIAERYRNCPENVLFEFLNEPHKNLNDEIWNMLIIETLREVRKSNPNRVVIIGPTKWNSIDKLEEFELPADDKNIIVTCHYYKPGKFTQQGAPHLGKRAQQWLGTKWRGTKEEKETIETHFSKVFQWGRRNNRPINIGEFGTRGEADMESRVMWTAFVVSQVEKNHFSWAYWGFCNKASGLYNPAEGKWIEPLLNTLVPKTDERDLDKK